MQNQEADLALQFGVGIEELHAPIHLVEHAGPDFRVSEEVNLTIFGDGPRLHFADVVKESRPANLELGHGLSHHLLGVLPNVLVAPLSITKADHRLDFWKQSIQEPGRE